MAAIALERLELLDRELAVADAAAAFAPILALTDRCIEWPAGHTCERCCHWSLPLNAPYAGRQTPYGVAMHFNEWLAWHYHVGHHQQLGPADRPLVA